jgi:hypothetical protein
MSAEDEVKSPSFVYSCIIIGSIIVAIAIACIFKRCINKKNEIEKPIITNEDLNEVLSNV